MIKVLGIVCSPRLGGNTEILLRESLAEAQKVGAEVELVALAQKTISPCDGCRSCYETKRCRVGDDMQDIYLKLLEADGIIFGTPVYFWTVSAQAKALIDRTYLLLNEHRLRNKLGAVVITKGRTGSTGAFTVFNNFFYIQRMIMVRSAIGLSDREKGQVRNDKQAISEAQALGRAMVRRVQYYQALAK